MFDLHRAAKVGDHELFCLYVNLENVNSYDSNGYAAIHYAAEGGHIDILKEIIKIGGDINIKVKHIPRCSALHFSVENSHFLFTDLLVDAGVDKESENFNEETAIWRVFSLKESRRLLLQFLIDRKFNFHHVRKTANTNFFQWMAISCQWEEDIIFLLSKFPEYYEKPAPGWKTVKELLKIGKSAEEFSQFEAKLYKI